MKYHSGKRPWRGRWCPRSWKSANNVIQGEAELYNICCVNWAAKFPFRKEMRTPVLEHLPIHPITAIRGAGVEKALGPSKMGSTWPPPNTTFSVIKDEPAKLSAHKGRRRQAIVILKALALSKGEIHKLPLRFLACWLWCGFRIQIHVACRMFKTRADEWLWISNICRCQEEYKSCQKEHILNLSWTVWNLCVWMSVCVSVYKHVSMSVCVGVYVCMCVHVSVCEWICVCVSGEGWIFCSALVQVGREHVLKHWALCVLPLYSVHKL